MPLLYKKAFIDKTPPTGLKDSDEVFYCELTNEIFTDYEEFCERIYLCNSLVWSCSITGRSNLTYQEALTSEENSRRILSEFPLTLRTPVFYLLTLCERKSVAELAEDIFLFARDRYFVGESVEVCFSNDIWCDCHIIQVTYPTDKVLEQFQANNGTNNNNVSSNNREYWPPSSLYSYEVEVIKQTTDGLTYFVRGDQVRRRKGVYTRDKNRLFIKQYVNQVDGIWKLKDDIYRKYLIDKINFNEIFAGDSSKIFVKKKSNKEQNIKNNEKAKAQAKKEKKQESIQKYFKQKSASQQNADGTSKKVTPQKKPTVTTPQKSLIQKLKNKYKGVQNVKKSKLIDKMVKKQQVNELHKKNKVKKLNENVKQKSLSHDELLKLAVMHKNKSVNGLKEVIYNLKLNKESRKQLAELVLELNKKREDLECEDLKDLPVPTAVQLAIPNEHFGDFVFILEFFNSFGRKIKQQQYFPYGMTMELLERAMIITEVAGPLNDLTQLLLGAIFELQEVDCEDADTSATKLDGVLDGDKKVNNELHAILLLSNAAACYSQHYLGSPLRELTLDCATLTEILRLHILSSGVQRCSDDITDRTSLGLDDPGRALCLNRPDLIKSLSHQTLFDLSIKDRLEIITCLINQILMFSTMRDFIDERGEKIKAGKSDLRSQQVAEVKRIREATVKAKEQKEKEMEKEREKDPASNNAPTGPVTLTAEEKEQIKEKGAKKEMELARKARELSEAEMEFQVLPLGVDRAYRRFWIFSSLPGLFVEDNELHPGTCLPKGTPYAVDADECLRYVRKLFEDAGTSNKENLVCINKDHLSISSLGSTVGSPNKKMLAEKNGSTPMDTSESSSNVKTPSRRESMNSKMNEQLKNACKPLTCWGDPITCPVHGSRSITVSPDRPIWAFYKNENDLDDLIESLNDRGYRESKLKKILVQEKERIVKGLLKCPLSKLDPMVKESESNIIRKSTRNGPKYDNTNLDYPPGTPVNEVLNNVLRDIILENEEMIYDGLLGSLKVSSREEWRKKLKNNEYDKLCDVLKWGEDFSDAVNTLKKSNSSNDSAPGNTLTEKVKQEDGNTGSNSRCQTPTSLIGLETLTSIEKNVTKPPLVYNLACAILQLEQAVEPKYLKKFLADEVKHQETSSTNSSTTSSTSTSSRTKKKKSSRERWEESLMSSNSLSQLFVHMYTLENSIEWERSALKSYLCKVCKQRDPEKMLLCDSCNKGFHMYCLKPKLTKIPSGDWFCPKCSKTKDCLQSKNKSKDAEEKSKVKEQEDDQPVIGRCRTCWTKGEVVQCENCEARFHLDCVNPPLRKFPRFSWTCYDCRHSSNNGGSLNKKPLKTRTKNKHVANDYSSSDDDDDEDDSEDSASNDVERYPSRRRCAKSATAKISQFAKQLRTNSLDGDGDDKDGEGKDNSLSQMFRRRSRRSIEANCNEVTAITSSRDLPLDNAALQEVLEIVMHHKDAWPFLRPVTKSEVPDYHKIIKNPMDFGMIKHKLNMLEYNKNSQVIADAMLVFQNCYTYNQVDSDVYKSGERLQKVFEKLCTERKMKINNSVNGVKSNEDDDMDTDDDNKKNEDEEEEEEEEEEVIRPPNSKRPRTVF